MNPKHASSNSETLSKQDGKASILQLGEQKTTKKASKYLELEGVKAIDKSRLEGQIQRLELQEDYTFQQFEDLKNSIFTSDIVKIHYGVMGMCHLANIAEDTLFQQCMTTQVLKRVCEFARQDQYMALKERAIELLSLFPFQQEKWIQKLLAVGSTTVLLEVLFSSTSSQNAVLGSIIGLGVIAEFNSKWRGEFMQLGVHTGLLKKLKDIADVRIIEEAVITTATIIESSFNIMSKTQQNEVVTVFCECLLKTEQSADTPYQHYFWPINEAMRYRHREISDLLRKLGMISKLVSFLSNPENQLDGTVKLIPVLQILTWVCASRDEKHIMSLFNLGLMEYIQQLLLHPQAQVRESTCKLISYIVTEKSQCTHQLFSHESIINTLVKMLNDKEEDEDIKGQIITIFTNPLTGSAVYKYKYFASSFYMQIGLMKTLLELLTSCDSAQMLQKCIWGIYLLLKAGLRTQAAGVWEEERQFTQKGGVGILQELENKMPHEQGSKSQISYWRNKVAQLLNQNQ